MVSLIGLSGGGPTESLSLLRGGGSIDGFDIATGGRAIGLGTLFARAMLELPAAMPRSVANLYFLILALEIRDVKWNTDTWGLGADMRAVKVFAPLRVGVS